MHGLHIHTYMLAIESLNCIKYEIGSTWFFDLYSCAASGTEGSSSVENLCNLPLYTQTHKLV